MHLLNCQCQAFAPPSKKRHQIFNEILWEVLIKHATLSNDINVYRKCADAASDDHDNISVIQINK